MSHTFWLALLTGVGLLGAILPAQAQYPGQPGYYPGQLPPNYYAPGYYPGRVGGALQGSAAVTQAQGDLMVQREEAYKLREKANQEKLQTKKQALDYANYERQNRWNYADEEARVKDLTLRRMLTSATPAEVASGTALNILLPYLNTLVVQGIQGPPVPLDQNLMRKVNVTIPGSNSGVGLLKDGGRLHWPFVLESSTQQRVASLLPEAVAAAGSGNLNSRQYYEITKGVEEMSKELSMKFRKEEIDGAGYVTGRRFLDSLEESVKMLQKPQVRQMLDGTYAANGRTVPELVDNMTRQGLKFAPSPPGSEEAYQALYYAMTSYAAGGQSNSGFRNQLSPGSQAGASRKN